MINILTFSMDMYSRLINKLLKKAIFSQNKTLVNIGFKVSDLLHINNTLPLYFALIDAINSNDYEMVKLLVSQATHINGKVLNDVLVYAIEKNSCNCSIVQLLTERGAIVPRGTLLSLSYFTLIQTDQIPIVQVLKSSGKEFCFIGKDNKYLYINNNEVMITKINPFHPPVKPPRASKDSEYIAVQKDLLCDWNSMDRAKDIVSSTEKSGEDCNEPIYEEIDSMKKNPVYDRGNMKKAKNIVSSAEKGDKDCDEHIYEEIDNMKKNPIYDWGNMKKAKNIVSSTEKSGEDCDEHIYEEIDSMKKNPIYDGGNMRKAKNIVSSTEKGSEDCDEHIYEEIDNMKKNPINGANNFSSTGNHAKLQRKQELPEYAKVDLAAKRMKRRNSINDVQISPPSPRQAREAISIDFKNLKHTINNQEPVKISEIKNKVERLHKVPQQERFVKHMPAGVCLRVGNTCEKINQYQELKQDSSIKQCDIPQKKTIRKKYSENVSFAYSKREPDIKRGR